MEKDSTINPLVEELKEDEKNVNYSDTEKEYGSYLQKRLETGRNLRNQNHDGFDGMSYVTYYQTNSQGANSFISPKKNREDTNFVTGTTRQALLAYVSKINSLNISPEVKAFDKDNKQYVHVGTALEDSILQADEMDNDEEKRILRNYELFSQGTVFVGDSWIQRFQVQKKGFDAKSWDGKIGTAKWTETTTKIFEGPSREIYPGLNVFLGKITEFDMEKQPYFFTTDYMHYDDAKTLFGEWERWKYVTRKVRYWNQSVPQTLYNNNWRLENTQENIVEVVIYRDVWSKEYMILLNGIMMMPPGFPLPWSYRGYDVIKQVYEIITPNFAYGGSMVKRLKVSQQLENEFWRLAILKTQKSFQPPRGNMTGQVVGSRVFMPGKITPGVNPSLLPSLDENNQGVTQGEVDMMNMLSQNLKDNSIPNLGQADPGAGGSNTSATEVMQNKQQADTMMQLALHSSTQLEKKLAYLRLNIILENGFKPIGTSADVSSMSIKNLFGQISRTTSIGGKGRGRRVTKISKTLPSSKDVYTEQTQMSKEENQPVKVVYLNPDELEQVRWNWMVITTPKEKETSELSRIMFGNMMGQAVQNFQQDLNLGYFEEKFSEAWNLNADKAFVQKSSSMMGMQPPQQGPQFPAPQAGQPGQPQPGGQPSGGLPNNTPNPITSMQPAVQSKMAMMAQK